MKVQELENLVCFKVRTNNANLNDFFEIKEWNSLILRLILFNKVLFPRSICSVLKLATSVIENLRALPTHRGKHHGLCEFLSEGIGVKLYSVTSQPWAKFLKKSRC